MSFEERLKTGSFGEEIVDRYLEQQGWVPYHPKHGVAHPFDRLLASPDKRKLCIVEVKTKWRREYYADTGINHSCFNDYQRITMTYAIPLFLVFVDAKLGQVYGQWWSELIKTREPEDRAKDKGCLLYPWVHKGIVYFQYSIMRVFYVIPDDKRQELLKLRVSNWKDEVTADDILIPE